MFEAQIRRQITWRGCRHGFKSAQRSEADISWVKAASIENIFESYFIYQLVQIINNTDVPDVPAPHCTTVCCKCLENLLCRHCGKSILSICFYISSVGSFHFPLKSLSDLLIRSSYVYQKRTLNIVFQNANQLYFSPIQYFLQGFFTLQYRHRPLCA